MWGWVLGPVCVNVGVLGSACVCVLCVCAVPYMCVLDPVYVLGSVCAGSCVLCPVCVLGPDCAESCVCVLGPV